ncbi:unnamed protein product [Darwinula stevensoni]|uniref:Transient receptor potential cation channel subfamily A member 1 n=1 Tax=Darwinula stevensoni TaxID=69355 RepID=A0A7R8X0Y6_9CRUS|nr:unnamed protein product [Darwinula stevensoni]CAG0881689.1 unnamed protein product [Darwinula stevensoni]
MALLRTFTMMLGELDFLGTFVQPYWGAGACGIQLPFRAPTFFFLVVFILFMPILLMNLLIGLAVGDIESVRRNAQLKRIAMQVELHSELERKLPRCFIAKVDKSHVVEYPNARNVCTTGILSWLLCGFRPMENKDGGEQWNPPEQLVLEELGKQKWRLRKLAGAIEDQTQLIRLIVQKMEIRTEADDCDEGRRDEEKKNQDSGDSRWKEQRMRMKLRSSSVCRSLNL